MEIRMKPDAGSEKLEENTVGNEDRRQQEAPRVIIIDRLPKGAFGEVGVQPLYGIPQVSNMYRHALTGPARRACGAEGLVVVRVDILPGQHILKMGGKGRLDQSVLAVDIGDHRT